MVSDAHSINDDSCDSHKKNVTKAYLQARNPWWKRLYTWLSRGRTGDRASKEGSTGPLTPDILRSLVQEELARTQQEITHKVQEEMSQVRDDVPKLVRTELTEEREERYDVVRLVLQDMADKFNTDDIQLLITDLEVLDQEILPALKGNNLSPRERLLLMNMATERKVNLEQWIARLNGLTSKHVIESELVTADLGGDNNLAKFRSELAQQGDRLASIKVGSRSIGAHLKGLIRNRLGLVLALLLVATIALAGILLRRRTTPSPRFLVDLATLYQTTGNTGAAIELLDEVVEYGVHDVEMMERVGETYHGLGEYEKAVELLTQAVDIKPQDEELRLSLARSYSEAGQPQEAITQYEWLVESDPVNWRFYFELGQQYEALLNYDQAFEQYRKVVDLTPDNIQGYTSQGILYLNLERYDEAIEQFESAVKIDPNNWSSRLLLGQSYAGLQEWDRAIEQFQATLVLVPDRYAPYLEMGKVWRAQGEYEEALSWDEDALDVAPNKVPTLLEIGNTYAEYGNCEQAVLHFLRILQIEPGNIEAQDGLDGCQGD